MSDTGSNIDENDFRHFLPTEELLLAGGNPVPLGLPFFRYRYEVDRDDNVSLLESLEGTSLGSAIDEVTSAIKPLGASYGTLHSLEDGVTLTWRDLSVYVPHKKGWFRKGHQKSTPFKRVVNNVSGAIKPGSLLALMGSSGAGKSTLMNALAHRTPGEVIVDGDILVNGRPASRRMAAFSGYVHQDDLFVGSLTVKEHLTFMARLRMDKSTTKEQRASRVFELIQGLGLQKVTNTRIGVPGLDKSLSGGERKRLAFATEILTDPPLLFCDEPTTGLDSFNARKLVRMMKEMASRGRTIVCTIHQPSSEVFMMFDKLLLLSEGRIAYMGLSTGAMEFFESLGHKCPSTFNPADFYIHTLAVLPGHEVSSRDRIRRICDNFAVAEFSKEIGSLIQQQENLGLSLNEDTLISREKPSWIIQLIWLTWRAFTDSYRNPAIHGVRILQKILIAVLVGLCYTNVQVNQTGIQDIEGVLFIFITENTFPSLYGVLNIFPQELPLFLRENKNGIYRTDAYYISKMASMVPGFIVDPFVFCTICYWMVGLQRRVYPFLMTAMITIFTANVASACGSMFSAAFESIPHIMLLLIPFDVALLVSGGLFINLASMPWFISWIKYASWFMYSNEALTITQWEGVTNITCELPPGIPCIYTGDEVIAKYSFSSSHLPLDFGLLTVLYLCFHVIGYLGLLARANRK